MTRNLYQFLPSTFIFTISLLLSTSLAAQSVEEIITDYQGYWESSVVDPNPNQPGNHHHLVAFSIGGTRYATGVNDSLLDKQQLDYVPTTFQAADLAQSLPLATNRTFIGLGSEADGVPQTGSTALTLESMERYLIYGTQGLDMGTCIANLAKGNLSFAINNIDPLAIGDGVPDILVTQLADPNQNKKEFFRFIDASGDQVGSKKNLRWDQLPAVGHWTADLFVPETSQPTPYSNTDHQIRMYAFDLSELGIHSGNYERVNTFQILNSGDSDPAFVAYNTTSFSPKVQAAPVEWKYITATEQTGSILVQWATVMESNTSHFAIERSSDGHSWEQIGRVAATGDSQLEQTYSYTDRDVILAETTFFRLRQIGSNGASTYSTTAAVSIEEEPIQGHYTLYPTNAREYIILSGDRPVTFTIIELSTGGPRGTGQYAGGDQRIDTSQLKSGHYTMVLHLSHSEVLPLRFQIY